MLIELLGWAGMVIVLGAYALVSTRRIEPDSRVYGTANVLGSVGLGINAFANSAWPIVALNAIWALVGMVNLMTYRRAVSRRIPEST